MNGIDSLRIDVALAETDVIKLILDFLDKRELFTSMVHLEGETEVVNQSLSEDLLYLRQLILNGQWDDVVDYVEPLRTIKGFDEKRLRYVLMKHQFLEMVCLKSESKAENQIVKFLNEFRKFVPTDQEYKKFSFLLTLKRLQDHPEYAQWNPYVNRVRCSKEIVPLVQPFVQNEKSNLRIAENDRLIQLLVKGLLYESSVEHCQARATNTTETLNLSSPTTLLNNTRLSDTDASLLSWLHALPPESFSSPFEQKSLVVQVEKVRKSEEKPRATPLERSLPTVEEEIVDEMAKGRAAILKHFDEEEEDAPFHSFVPLVRVEDAQVIRAVDVHPSGAYFAVGSNSKILRVCVYPTSVQPGKVLFQKGKHHQGSIYCLTWSPSGCLLSSGSNDKTIKILRLDVDRPDDPLNNSEVQLSHHDGTIRDLLFLDETQLLSGGAGERNLVLSDVRKQVALQTFEGHRGHVYALHSWERNCFVSAGDDGTCRLWDARQVAPVHSLPARSSASPVASVAVNFSGEILAAGYEDAFCLLYDLRTRRNLQIYQPHADQVRSVRFAGRTNVLLSASYDKQVILTNLDGRSDLTKPLVHSKVATHSDKIIQARWHPTKLSFVTSSADRSCVVWTSSSSSR